MTFGALIVVLLLVGVVLAMFPVDAQIKKLIIAVCVVAVLFALLAVFGVLDAGVFGRRAV